MKSLVISLVVILSFIEVAAAQETVRSTTTNYIRVEVRGSLQKESYHWYLEAEDKTFPQYKAKVVLERSEDKDRELDRFLEEHMGQEVIARGLLDTRRISSDSSTIYIFFRDRSNIWTADKDKPANLEDL